MKGFRSTLGEGRLIVLRSQGGSGIIGLPSDNEAITRVGEMELQTGRAVILIREIEQLYDYVVRIPDLAWDLMEFAEKPLAIEFEAGKNVPGKLLGADGSIRISLVRDPLLQEEMKGLRPGVFYLPVISDADNTLQEEILSPKENVIILQKEFLASPQARTARLGMDGTIKFL